MHRYYSSLKHIVNLVCPNVYLVTTILLLQKFINISHYIVKSKVNYTAAKYGDLIRLKTFQTYRKTPMLSIQIHFKLTTKFA